MSWNNGTSYLFPLLIVVLAIFIITKDGSVQEEEDKKIVKTDSEDRLFTAEELSQYDGNRSTRIYLAVLGEVYDVTDGEGYYGPGQGYSCFAGRDGSRAFVTGNFTKEGARADLDGLTPGEVAGVIHWRDFYRKEDKYKYLGKLVGLYYDENGNAREEIHESIERRLAEHEHIQDNKKKLEARFPKCSSKWTQKTGKMLWCEDNRVPRNFTDSYGSRSRCACVRPGEEIEDSVGTFTQYKNCDLNESKCHL